MLQGDGGYAKTLQPHCEHPTDAFKFKPAEGVAQAFTFYLLKKLL